MNYIAVDHEAAPDNGVAIDQNVLANADSGEAVSGSLLEC
jgi:hypothetical protein